ncbi:MAG: hypothetical protein KKB95_09515 [Gammaproteobacteria bacterium]|nr:hypothetical protein [Gammaproteobacteria bacterium]MBU1505799.1 hypothetical protein [Gammaproteobacteria bacterium]MBU2119487.1 hypothetical protein [Gammaproteobacteria bacterium]MBU2172607.1 hypothetical protein [Gammaproteobacteria bacterium]MBU2202065.1 hypothetical protein [Gammaproteobacteria bacterium]
MKKCTLNLYIAAGLAFFGGAAHADSGFEIKGLKIGMSEAEFKKINPSAKCALSARDPSWDKTVKDRRTCSVPGFTLATKKAQSSQFLFFEDKLGSWNASFYEFYGKDLQGALTEKFGAPLMEPRFPGVSWKSGSTLMQLVFTGSSALLVVQSDISTDWGLKLQEFKLRKGKADL